MRTTSESHTSTLTAAESSSIVGRVGAEKLTRGAADRSALTNFPALSATRSVIHSVCDSGRCRLHIPKPIVGLRFIREINIELADWTFDELQHRAAGCDRTQPNLCGIFRVLPGSPGSSRACSADPRCQLLEGSGKRGEIPSGDLAAGCGRVNEPQFEFRGHDQHPRCCAERCIQRSVASAATDNRDELTTMSLPADRPTSAGEAN